MTAKNRDSIIGRVTLFTGVVAAVLCALLAAVLMAAVYRYATGALVRDLRTTAARVAGNVENGRIVQPLTTRPGRDIQILDPGGRVVASTGSVWGRPPMTGFTPSDPQAATDTVVCDGVFGPGRCKVVAAEPVERMDGRWLVYVSSPVIPLWVEPDLAVLVGTAAVALAVAVTFLGRRVVTASLRPVGAIRRELDEINVSRLGRRVPAPRGRSEIHELAESINHTLARLEDAMERQRRFASDASHDLRTPIAAIRAETEDALMAPEQADVPALGGAILRNVDRLESIVSDLLAIARLDAGVPGAREPVDLAEVADQECRTRCPSGKALACHLQPGVMVLGDRPRLGRLLTNLLDNADRHAESAITVTVRRDGGEGFPNGVAVLEVIDDGPGIAPENRELVFRRFTRLDPARSRDAGGTGLGLAIARQIAETHGGTLRIEDSPRGARFVLRVPCLEQATAAAPRGEPPAP
ncbi:two-component sensor histidine kinase [Sphaerisporangium krabiense]|uniref:sensor histidine kinase n=1 Tax=Sphaerisporangium krabiense TaxID=763782 RepID=UPI0019512FA3|nr:HAMP domain-containing sensor histidine kinase [Sphaerisporangium krabiense]GII61100.1 two-component sensor histidine kinase [Sphaerisporangium krabiense]